MTSQEDSALSERGTAVLAGRAGGRGCDALALWHKDKRESTTDTKPIVERATHTGARRQLWVARHPPCGRSSGSDGGDALPQRCEGASPGVGSLAARQGAGCQPCAFSVAGGTEGRRGEACSARLARHCGHRARWQRQDAGSAVSEQFGRPAAHAHHAAVLHFLVCSHSYLFPAPPEPAPTALHMPSPPV